MSCAVERGANRRRRPRHRLRPSPEKISAAHPTAAASLIARNLQKGRGLSSLAGPSSPLTLRGHHLPFSLCGLWQAEAREQCVREDCALPVAHLIERPRGGKGVCRPLSLSEKVIVKSPSRRHFTGLLRKLATSCLLSCEAEWGAGGGG